MGIEMQISMNDPGCSFGIMDTDSLRGRDSIELTQNNLPFINLFVVS